MVRYAGLYARCVKRKWADIANAALEAIRDQIPLFATVTLLKVVTRLKWRDRIKASFGYDPLECPKCCRTMELAEIWEPKRGFVWMQRWLETHRMRKAARDALKAAEQVKQSTRRPPQKYQQLPFVWNTS
jgi:3'-phosphoadenosine 5'-phosphosulfate sulfotransferase (PAPS reductase)/FAD synthetase